MITEITELHTSSQNLRHITLFQESSSVQIKIVIGFATLFNCITYTQHQNLLPLYIYLPPWKEKKKPHTKVVQLRGNIVPFQLLRQYK